MVKWSRTEGYEVSSLGDWRFSAFNAILEDGRSILSYWRESGEFSSKNNCVVAGKTLTERDYQPSTQKYQCLEK